MLRRRKLVIFNLLLICAVIVPVFAYMYFYRTDLTSFGTGVMLQTYPTPTMKLGFYWDPACTQPATYIDFGQIIHPNQECDIEKTIYIRNEGSSWHAVYWNSTLGSVTDIFTDGWAHIGWWGTHYPVNGTSLEQGQVLESHYYIHVPAYATIGTYNWTLTAWGENWY